MHEGEAVGSVACIRTKMCGPGESGASIAFIVGMRAEPGVRMEKTALFTRLLPSLHSSITRAERAQLATAGPVCLYLFASDQDAQLMREARELTKSVRSTYRWLGMRLLFFSAPFAVREAAFAAFSDGAKLIHHTYPDAAYASAGWLGVAMSSIRSRHPFGYSSAAITRADASSATESSTTSAPVVSRRHLEVFSELYPRQITETWALNVWMDGVYADDAPTAVANGGSGSDSSSGLMPLLPGLVECGRHLLRMHRTPNRTLSPASCSATTRRVPHARRDSDCLSHSNLVGGVDRHGQHNVRGFWCARSIASTTSIETE